MRCRFLGLLLVVSAWCVVAGGQSLAKRDVADQALMRTIAQVLRDVSVIEPGMTRADLLRIFTTEGGMSNRDTQQFVYRRCPSIKIVVNFRRPNDADDNWAGAPEVEWTGDVIQSISKPFLEYPIAD